nr:YhjD/YihY/BrkB family envelope integrity protein [uncultured Rothia sp.]
MAAALTYFTVLSVFPALLAIVSLLGIFGQGEDSATAILAFLKDNAPTQMYGILEDPIKQLTSGQGAGLVLLTGISVPSGPLPDTPAPSAVRSTASTVCVKADPAGCSSPSTCSSPLHSSSWRCS